MDTAQLKVTLPVRLYDFVQAKAEKFGLTMSAYLKHLIFEDVKDMDLPTFPMSAKTEASLEKALEDLSAGRAKKFKSVDALMSSL